MEPSGTGRMVLSVLVLGFLALAVRFTMEPGKYEQLTWLLLGFFAIRVVLGWMRSRRIVEGRRAGPRDRDDAEEG